MGHTYQPAITHIIPRSALTRREQILLGALLREPFNLSKHIGVLNRTALALADGTLGTAFTEILDQFSQFGKYSPVTIEQRTGIDFSVFASNDTEIDLEWSIVEWWEEYQKWGEAVALTKGISESAMNEGALAMRAAVEAERERLGLNGAVKTKSSVEAFVSWGMDKLDGKEVKYKTTPHLAELRKVIHAFEPGELWLIPARPSMGKSQFALNLFSHFYDQGATGMFVSLEMSGVSLMKRMLGIRHGFDPRDPWHDDKLAISRAISETASIDDRAKIVNGLYHIGEIESAAISAHYRGELDYLIIDYLQLIVPSGKRENQNVAIGSISSALKRLSDNLQCPVIALSQLSRAVEQRGGSKRPLLSDLRDSGSLEQDADGVIFPYRPEYYRILEDANGESLVGIGEVIVAKQRNGPTESIKARWNPIKGYQDLVTDTRFPTMPTDYTVPASEAGAIINSSRPSDMTDIPF